MTTLEERAERIIDFWLNDKTPDFKIKSNIMCEILAAIEEDRRARECCKETREACARIADGAIGARRREIAAMIRARSKT
jgi:hypothetical protein